MARPHRDEVPAEMAVLGLVIDRPNQSAAWYSSTLAQRFPRAGFGPSTAHTALGRLARADIPLVRRIHGAGTRYAALADGLDAFQAWMFRPPTAIPAVRQVLYGRIALARLEDLPRLIRVVREEETIATHLYEHANRELRQHEMRKRSRSGASRTRADFEREIHETWLYVDPLHWSSRAELCLMVLDHLEDIAHEAGIFVGSPATDLEHPRERAG